MFASPMRSRPRRIRTRWWCRSRPLIRPQYPIPRGAGSCSPAAPAGGRSPLHWQPRSEAIPMTRIWRAAFWRGKPPACRRSDGMSQGRHWSLFVASLIALGLLALVEPADAQSRRVVNVYNWSDYINPGVIEDFTKETGIEVRYDTFDSNDTLEAKLLAGRSGYDVVVPTAYFLERQIKAGVFQKLDKSKVPNLANMWPEISQRLAAYDPGNQYAVNYMWGTTGIGYNVKKARELLGANGKIDSWDIVFKPENLAKFKDCGVHLLDSSDDILSAALHYLGLDPNTTKEADLQKAADLVSKIRPYVRK